MQPDFIDLNNIDLKIFLLKNYILHTSGMSIFTTCECKNAARIYRFNNLDLKLFLIKNVFCTLAKQYHF